MYLLFVFACNLIAFIKVKLFLQWKHYGVVVKLPDPYTTDPWFDPHPVLTSLDKVVYPQLCRSIQVYGMSTWQW